MSQPEWNSWPARDGRGLWRQGSRDVEGIRRPVSHTSQMPRRWDCCGRPSAMHCLAYYPESMGLVDGPKYPKRVNPHRKDLHPGQRMCRCYLRRRAGDDAQHRRRWDIPQGEPQVAVSHRLPVKRSLAIRSPASSPKNAGSRRSPTVFPYSGKRAGSIARRTGFRVRMAGCCMWP